MRYLPDKRNKISPGSPAVATPHIVPKICQGQPPTMYSEWSTFHQNQFIFYGVIAECMNNAKTHCKVNLVFSKLNEHYLCIRVCSDIHANLYLYVVTTLRQKFSILKILYVTLPSSHSGSGPISHRISGQIRFQMDSKNGIRHIHKTYLSKCRTCQQPGVSRESS